MSSGPPCRPTGPTSTPHFLFIVGGSSRAYSTGEVGAFLIPLAVLVPAGVYALARGRIERPVAAVLLFGLLLGPVAATLKGSPYEVQRTTLVIPFAVLISSVGMAYLWSAGHRQRLLVIVLLAVMPLQFARFYADYLSEYRVRAAAVHDPTAFAEVAPYLIGELTHAPELLLGSPMYDVSAKWRFHLIKHDRLDLLQRTRYVPEAGTPMMPAAPGSLAVLPVNAPWRADASTRDWRIIRTVVDIAGRETLVVLRAQTAAGYGPAESHQKRD